MLYSHLAVFCAILLLSESALAEISDLSAAPEISENASVAESKFSEIPLTPLEELDFRKNDDRERVYNKKDNTPFSGALQQKDDEGLIITFFYRNGYKHGIAVAYAEDGHLEQETTYRKGYKDGEEMIFYENGKPKLKQTFAKDVLNGEEIIFYNTGKPERINNYLDGKLNGQVTYLDRDGNTTKIEHYENGQKNGVEHIIVNNMLAEENNYKDGVLDGITKKYNDQFLSEEILYKDGKKNGISKKYLENGSWSEMNYVDDALNGISKSFYPDKKVAETVNYAENKRNGLAEKFNQDGFRISSENYKNGKLEGISRKFNETGELTNVAYYVNGLEMAVINIDENTELRDIYNLYKKDSLNKIITKKNLWYPILWLGINLEKSEVLTAIENEMKMYVYDIADFSVFQRESKSKFEEYNRKLFFGLTPLAYAVNITAPVDILQKFASVPENIDEKNPRGTTALIEAVRLNNLEMIKYLLAHQANVTTVYGGGNTILLYAIKENAQNGIVTELIKAGADINAADINGQTPLTLAISANNQKLVDTLLTNNADIKQKPGGKTLLAYAFENNVTPEIFSRLIVGGADINAAGDDGNILLIQALSAAKYDIAEQLLQNGADVNLENQNGDSALSYVLSHDVPDNILIKIVDNIVDPLKNTPKYDKPLWKVLAEQGRYDLLQHAVKNMGGIDVKDSNGETVYSYFLSHSNDKNLYELVLSFLSEAEIRKNSNFLFDAIKAKNLDLIKKLVERGADVNAVNSEGKTVLSYLLEKHYPLEYIEAVENGKLDINANKALETAIERNNIDLATSFIKNGADVNLLTSDRKSYLMILKYNQDKMTELLLTNGADIEYVPDPNKTLLMYAVKSGNATLIKYLISKDFSVNQADAEGNMSIMYITEMIEQYKNLPIEELKALLRKVIPILQKSGADINSQNNNGETLLIRLAKQNKSIFDLVLDTLVTLGADAERKDQYGNIAADYAK